MARSEKEQASRLRKAREAPRLKQEQARDTPEAAAERRKQAPQEYDENAMKKRVGNPGAALLS